MQSSMENDKPLVTCIIPSYNSPEIKTAIKSLLEQDYPRIELVVTDDGSKDFDAGDIGDFIDKDKKENIEIVNIIANPVNIGTVRNLNQAIQTSHGEYFINLAADDKFYSGDVISQIVRCFIETGADIVIGNAKAGKDGSMLYQSDIRKYLISEKVNRKIYNRLARGNFISGAVTYYSREYFNRYGLFNEEYYLIEDWPAILKCMRNDIRWTYYGGITILYDQNGISTRKDSPVIYLEDYEKVIADELLANQYLLTWFTKRYCLFMLAYTHNKRVQKPNLRNYIVYPDICMYKLIKRIGENG